MTLTYSLLFILYTFHLFRVDEQTHDWRYIHNKVSGINLVGVPEISTVPRYRLDVLSVKSTQFEYHNMMHVNK